MSSVAKTILQDAAVSCGLSAHIEPFVADGSAECSLSLRECLQQKPFLMAPMAGVSDSAYRIMARAGGAQLAYTEMVSVAGIHFHSKKTWELVCPHELEPDLAVQLFGSDPKQFFEAAEQITLRLKKKLVLLDVNMACPVAKVIKKGEGAALMQDVPRAQAILQACRKGNEKAALSLGIAPCPLTCKIRLGMHSHTLLAPDFAQKMQEAGASAIAVHGRFADQLYRGTADRAIITQIASALDIPLIISGDITDAKEAVTVLKHTHATAVMIARGSLGNPWIFDGAKKLLGEKNLFTPTLAQKLAAFAMHIRLLDATSSHLARARFLAAQYLRGIPEAAYWRNRAMHCQSAQDYLELISQISRGIL